MNSDKSQPRKPRREFGGCIELVPARPDYTEFIDAHRIWGFPMRQLEQFVLEENPQHDNKRTSPPHQLLLVYPEALVFLRGWRLELMLGPLVTGRIARVHAEKHLGTLILDEAWVSEIHVVPLDSSRQSTSPQSTPAKPA
jgi:hypothetical protein